VGNILHEGMKGWNGSRKARFQKKHKKILDKIGEAEEKHFPNYTDAELTLAKRDRDRFYAAYNIEQKAHNKEAGIAS